MNTTINQRVKEIADKLCDGNISELARITGIKQPSLRDVVSIKKVKPRSDLLISIANCPALQINTDWLLTGKGPMQKLGINILHNHSNKDIGHELINVYDISAAGNLNTLLKKNSRHLLGTIKIMRAPLCDGAIYATDNSMYPQVRLGDMVAYKQLHCINNITWGEIYLIDLTLDGKDILAIREVRWEEQNSTLRLISCNDQYEDMILPVSAVKTIALIKIVVNINRSE